MTSPCTRCGQPARWRSDDELLCAAHGVEAGLRGRRLTLEPAEDVVDRLLVVLTNDGLCREAADEIRRLRARLAERGGRSGTRGLRAPVG